MNERKATKRALLTSITALAMCVVMLVGTTFAWFTDTASTGVNKIVSGNLHVEIQDKEGTEIDTLKWVDKNGNDIANQDDILWEPGCTYLLTPFKIANTGNLALKYKIVITGLDGDSPLLNVIKFTYKVGGVESLLNEEGHLTAKGTAGASTDMITVSAHMDKDAGNDYMGKTLEGVKFTVYATQDTVENDSFNNTYDANATYYPVIDLASLKDAVGKGGNITIAGDFTGDATKTALSDRLTIKTPTTLNFEGIYTVPGSLESSLNWAALYITEKTTINATDDTGIICEDKTDSSAGYIGGPFVADINAPGKTVTVNGGTYYGGGTTFQVTKGTLLINSGFFQVAPDINTHDYRYNLNCIDDNYRNGTAKIIVQGGTFVNFNPANCKAEGEDTNFVAEGYGVVATPQANGDVWYTVVAESTTGKTFGSGTHTLSTGITAIDANAVAVYAKDGADITITGGAYDGGDGGNNICVRVDRNSKVTIKDGTFTVGGDANGYGNSVVYTVGGSVTIEGGFFYTDYQYRDFYYVLNQDNAALGTITVKGGTFVNYDPSKGDDNLGGNFVADGYKVETSTHGNDTWYTVVPE